MIIRRQQKQALAQQAMRNFQQRMYAHVNKVFLEDCERMGEQAVRELISKGTARAAEYGIETEYDVARYIDLMFILCEDFNTNPRLPWAGRILNDENMKPTVKVDRLYERTDRELQRLSARHTS